MKISLLALIFVFTSVLMAEEFPSTTPVSVIEANYEKEILSSIEQMLGKDLGTLVKVKAKVEDTEKNAKPSLDVAYLPIPPTKINLLGPNANNQKISNLDVNIKILAEMDPNLETQIKDLVNFSIKNIPASIKIEKFNVNKDQNRKIASDENKENKPLSELIQEWKWSFFLLLGLLSIVGFLLAMKIMSNGLQTAADNLAGGFRLNNRTTPPDDKSDKEEAEIKSETIDVEHSLYKDQIPTNVSFLEDILKEDSSAFFTALTSDVKDKMGFKWLLTKMNPEVVSLIKKVMDKSRLQELLATDENEDDLKINLAEWLQKFTERQLVNKMKEENIIDRALSASQKVKLYSWNAEIFNTGKDNVSDNAIWRLAAEVLTQNEFADLTKGIDAELWNKVILSADVNDEAVLAAYQNLEEFVEKDKKSEGSSKNKYINERLLVPMIDSIRSKPFGQDDEMIQSLCVNNKELEEILRAKVWTAANLRDIPETFIKSFIYEQSTEVVFSLIYSLPEDLAKSIDSMLDSGNKKIIIQDLVQRAKQKATDKEQLAARNLARKAIDDLRTSYQKGDFKLKSEDNKGKDLYAA